MNAVRRGVRRRVGGGRGRCGEERIDGPGGVGEAGPVAFGRGLLRPFARGDAGMMGHGGAQPVRVARQRPERGEHHPPVGRDAIAVEAAAPVQRLLAIAVDERDGAGALFIQPHVHRPVPRGGKAVRAGPLPQLIGRPRRTAHAARRLRHHAAVGQGVDKGVLRIRRPPPCAASMGDGGEVERIGRGVGHAGEDGMGRGV